MSGEYLIVRVSATSIEDGVGNLEKIVAGMCADGWMPAGGPFQNTALNQWCQALCRAKKPNVPGLDSVPLREPQPLGVPLVHSDPKDGPLKMREPKP